MMHLRMLIYLHEIIHNAIGANASNRFPSGGGVAARSSLCAQVLQPYSLLDPVWPRAGTSDANEFALSNSVFGSLSNNICTALVVMRIHIYSQSFPNPFITIDHNFLPQAANKPPILSIVPGTCECHKRRSGSTQPRRSSGRFCWHAAQHDGHRHGNICTGSRQHGCTCGIGRTTIFVPRGFLLLGFPMPAPHP